MSKQLKIALFGATGMIGSRIAAEAARRGHQVTALVRDPARVPAGVANLHAAQADLLDAASVGAAVRGQDVVASAYAPPQGDLATLTQATRALVEGVRAAGLKRVVVVGGAGSLEVAPGKQLVDTDSFPPRVQGHRARASRRLGLLPRRDRSRLDVLRAGRADRAGRAHRQVPHGREHADRGCGRQQPHFGRRLRDRVRRRTGAGPLRPPDRDGRVLTIGASNSPAAQAY
ncbi:putative NADH-flavin reductase [Paraburkholderia youngii]